MQMKLPVYKDKVRACFLGKNIGGTLGMPFECRRGLFDVSYYTHDINGEPLPNDDLDLQLVWLNAVERFGRGVNAQALGEYWLSYITPSWCEYGAAKNNMRMGLNPPLSGYINNLNRDSCGAFIRSELWACLAPGHPEIAVKYAYEDAIVDHSYEGVYAEIFTAAIQSSAFVEGDRDKLIEIGLSYIPEDSGVYRAVRHVVDAYKSGKDWKKVREEILADFPSTFGLMCPDDGNGNTEVSIPETRIGYDTPCNIALMVLGLVYGEGDFGNSICIAASCGEDADCTAATLGALLGIIGGTDSIDKKWADPIGDKIATISINMGDHDCDIPKTVTELTDRIIALVPSFLGHKYYKWDDNSGGLSLLLLDNDNLMNRDRRRGPFDKWNFLEKLKMQPFGQVYDSPIFTASLLCSDAPYISADGEIEYTLKLENKFLSQQFLSLRWFLPEEFEAVPAQYSSISLEQYHGNVGKAECRFKIKAPQVLREPKYDLVLEISANARHTKLYIPVTLLNMKKPEYD